MRLAASLLVLASLAAANAADEKFPQTIPSPGGEIYLNNAFERDTLYNDWHFAPARRAGDYVFISGVVAGPQTGEAKTTEAFKTQLRRAFTTLKNTLAAANLTFADVVEIESFHVFESEHFQGDKKAHFAAMHDVKDEFVKAPYPAWTAVGVTALATPTGIVEIKLTAYAPKKRAARTTRETKFASLVAR
jgi:enamine deaminase RidA (YjgF/YER057c/UK114 family)